MRGTLHLSTALGGAFIGMLVVLGVIAGLDALAPQALLLLAIPDGVTGPTIALWLGSAAGMAALLRPAGAPAVQIVASLVISAGLTALAGSLAQQRDELGALTLSGSWAIMLPTLAAIHLVAYLLAFAVVRLGGRNA